MLIWVHLSPFQPLLHHSADITIVSMATRSGLYTQPNRTQATVGSSSWQRGTLGLNPPPAAGLPGKHCAHLVKLQWFKAVTSNRLSAEIQTELEQKARWPVTPFFQTSSEFKYCGVKLSSLPYLHQAGCFREASGRMAHVFTQVLLTFIFINFPL